MKNMMLNLHVELCLFQPNILLSWSPQALNLLVELTDAKGQLDSEIGAAGGAI